MNAVFLTIIFIILLICAFSLEKPEEVYLSFDTEEGCTAEDLNGVLETLGNVKATFFLVGRFVEANPSLVKKIISKGHEVGCHSYSHPKMYKLNLSEKEFEISRCVELLNELGVDEMGFRAPHLMLDKETATLLDGFAYDASIVKGYEWFYPNVKNELKVSSFLGLPLMDLTGLYYVKLPWKFIMGHAYGKRVSLLFHTHFIGKNPEFLKGVIESYDGVVFKRHIEVFK
jgi:peptidoglycan/xylan/chitin deacetylase (PgdA/CDA1 family)